MKQKRLPTILFSIFVFLFVVTYLLKKMPSLVFSAPAEHLVISEIQISGDNVNDEFVELYNPTSTAVDLEGWRLSRRTSGGDSDNTMVSSMIGIIPAHGFFLIAHPEYDDLVSPDLYYSATSSGKLASNNSVRLYSDAGQTLVDLVGLGSSESSESATIDNPSANGSVERKALSSSTASSMQTGGIDEFSGNGEDTDDNSVDFVIRTTSNPQNSSSDVEVLASPLPTPSPTPSPSPSPTPSVSPSPSPTPSPSSSPFVSPTPSPSPSPSPEVTPSPSPTPSVSPSTSPTPSPSPSPSTSPSPNPLPNFDRVVYRGYRYTCGIRFVHYQRFFFSFLRPQFFCIAN